MVSGLQNQLSEDPETAEPHPSSKMFILLIGLYHVATIKKAVPDSEK
jgi:hypothetical protein